MEIADFRTAPAYRLARRLADGYDAARDGEWGAYVEWACGYDVETEIRAGESETLSDADVTADAETIRGLA